MNVLISYAIQAMGLGKFASRLTLCRHALLNIPLMFLLDHCFGLFGMICARPLAELLVLPLSAWIYIRSLRQYTAEFSTAQ